MFDITPNARQLAQIFQHGQHQYMSAEEIAIAYQRRNGYCCAAAQIEAAIQGFNSQGVICFDEMAVNGQKKFSPLFYMRWYPESKTISTKSFKWEYQYRKLGNKKLADSFDVYYYDWLMGRRGCPITFQACYYTLLNPDLLKYPTHLLYKLSDWAEIGTEEVLRKMDEAVARCWCVRQGRELCQPSSAYQYFAQNMPLFMTWTVFLQRLRTAVGINLTLEQSYMLLWDDSPAAQELLKPLDAIAATARIDS